MCLLPLSPIFRFGITAGRGVFLIDVRGRCPEKPADEVILDEVG
nr:MAG TPA: hypothetical protein [Caudoviricetes sp.]DAL19162.1 MAG TPA_asm: hypothetical protein [Caudoviricetes sp.]